MCARDLRPLSIVNGVGFRNFVHSLDPTYVVPSHTTMKNYTNYYYGSLKQTVATELQSQSSLAFTTDTWTSCATEGYLTLTAHFIDSMWQLRYYVLATIEVKDHHTGENLANEIKCIVEDFGISNTPVSGITTDNAANMVTMTTHLDWPHIRCFAHTLQLSVKAGLKIKEISSAAAAARKLVGHFKRSSLASNELKSRQRQLDLPEHSLLQDVPTRWNATYIMFERLIEQRLAIFAVLHNNTITSPSDARILELPDQVWKVIEDLVPVLKPLQVATTTISGTSFPTLSMVYPIVIGLLKNHLNVQGEDSTVLVKFKEAVTKDLSSRFPKSDHDLATHHAVLTCALDPRYKSLKFMTDEQRNLVKSSIEKFDTQTEQVPVEPPVAVKSENTDNAESNKAEVNAMSFLLGDLVDLTGEEVDAEKSLVQEYEMFVRETAVKGNADPLDWWKNKADSYKKLAPIAKFFLCIPGTSVPSERVFSDTGNIVTKKRASLDPDTVNQLVFLRSVLSSTKTKVDSAEESVLPDDKNSASTSALEVKQERASEPPSPSKKESLPPLPLLEPDNDEDD